MSLSIASGPMRLGISVKFEIKAVGLPSEFRPEYTQKDEYDEMRQTDDIEVGLSDFTNKLRIFQAISTLNAVETAKNRIKNR